MKDQQKVPLFQVNMPGLGQQFAHSMKAVKGLHMPHAGLCFPSGRPAKCGVLHPSQQSCDPGYLGLSGLHFPQLQNGAHPIFPTRLALTLGPRAWNLNSCASVSMLVKGASESLLPHTFTELNDLIYAKH